jgi:hypothetical protein
MGGERPLAVVREVKLSCHVGSVAGLGAHSVLGSLVLTDRRLLWLPLKAEASLLALAYPSHNLALPLQRIGCIVGE